MVPPKWRSRLAAAGEPEPSLGGALDAEVPHYGVAPEDVHGRSPGPVRLLPEQKG